MHLNSEDSDDSIWQGRTDPGYQVAVVAAVIVEFMIFVTISKTWLDGRSLAQRTVKCVTQLYDKFRKWLVIFSVP